MKLDNVPDFQAHLPRQGHNLSHDFYFTSSTGHLLPIMYQIMSPKETIEGSVSMFSRTQPFVNAANVDIDEHVDYFFVPITMLCSNFGEMFFRTNENFSALFKDKNKFSFPVFDSDPFEQGFITRGSEDPSSSASIVPTSDQVGDEKFLTYYRLLWHLGMNPNYLFTGARDDAGVVTDKYQPVICNFAALAYQACYQWFYRIDEREKFDARFYNIDVALYNNNSIWTNTLDSFKLRYRPYKTDYFMGVHVSPLINTLNLKSQNDLLEINNYFDNVLHTSVDARDSSTSLDSSTSINSQNALNDQPVVNTNALRSMFAVEKLLSITGRSKKTYDAQVMAHFGVKMPQDYYHELQYLGSQHGSIKIGEVISTAQTAGEGGAALGDIAGKGYGGLKDKTIKFTAPCHGVFIAIYSAVPRPVYYAPIDKQVNITTRLDFPIAEYYKLGLQPLFGYEALAGDNMETDPLTVQGWQMRYSQFVDRFNRVSPAFTNPITGDKYERFNQWSTWVFSKRPFRMQNDSAPSLDKFLCTPFDLNNFMVESYLPSSKWSEVYGDMLTQGASETTLFSNPALMFQRDPLLHFARCNFKLVSTIPANTLPKLD